MYSATRTSLPQINQCLLQGKSLPSSTSMYKSYAKTWSHTKLIFSGKIMSPTLDDLCLRRRWPRNGVGLRLLACWDCGFKSRRGYGCCSLVNAVCCAGRGLCDGPIHRPGESNRSNTSHLH